MHQLLINLSSLFEKPTGLGTYALNLIPHLKHFKPTLLTTTKIDNFNCYLVPETLKRTPGSKGHFRRLLWTQQQIPPIYRQLQSSLLFSPIPEAPLYSKCRFVVTAHDVIPLRFGRKHSPLRYYFRYYVPQVLQQAQHIVCNSNATAKDLIEFYGIEAKKITPIPLAYDSKHFQLLNEQNKLTEPYFLNIGRQEPYKNLQRLIEAFAQITKNHPHQLWLVGPTDPRYTPPLKTLAEELNISDRLRFLEYVDYEELPLIINNATALVFPSLWEGFGLPALEAMACGTPVICSNLSALPEVTGDAAMLINPYNSKEISQAMEEIAKDNNLRNHLSDRCLTRASQFSWEKTAQATAEILGNYL